MKGYCLQCGAQLNDGDLFCMACGAQVAGMPSASVNVQADAPAGQVQQAVQYGETGEIPLVKAAESLAAPPVDYDAPEYRTVFQDDAEMAAGAAGQAVANGISDADDSPTIFIAPEFTPFLMRTGTGVKASFELPAVLGKGSAATCVLSGNPAISRQHVRIEEADEGYFIEDLSSTNGTWVNEERLEPGFTHALAEGDTVRLADETFTFGLEEKEY